MVSYTAGIAAALSAVALIPAVGLAVAVAPHSLSASVSTPQGPPDTIHTVEDSIGIKIPSLSAPKDTSPPTWGWTVTNPDGSPVRWNPCSTITWKWIGAKSKDRKLMRQAVKQLSSASGISFQETSSNPLVTIRYSSDPSKSGAIGIGGFSYTGGSQKSTIVKGFIKIDTKLKKKRTAKNYSTTVRKGIFLHEWGHVVGLEHVSSRNEIMFSSVTGQLKTYGAGDRRGLRILGNKAGCAS